MILKDESSDEEGTHSMKRSARHSVDAEIPDQLITHFYPVDDNYDPHPTDPTLRCPKSLTDLCGEFIALLLVRCLHYLHSSVYILLLSFAHV